MSARLSSAFQHTPQEVAHNQPPVATGSPQAEEPSRPFSIEELIRSNIRSLTPYRCARDDFSTGILLDANENAYGPSLPKWPADIMNSLAAGHCRVSLNRYPDPRQSSLKRRFVEFRGLPSPDYVFLGVGSDEVIDLLIRVCCEPRKDKIMITPPTYGMYQVCAQINDVRVCEVPLNLEDGQFQLRVDEVKCALLADPEVKIVFLCSPGNPTGSLLNLQDIKELLEYRPYRGLFVVDEAYIDFVKRAEKKDSSVAKWVQDYPNLFVAQTLSKSFGLAGIRLGIGIAQPALINYLNKAKAPYNLGTPTISVAEEALSVDGVEVMKRNVSMIMRERERLVEALESMPRIGRILGQCDANFVLAEILDRDGNPSNAAARAAYETLAREHGVIIRYRGNEQGCFACLRITVGTTEEANVLLREMTKVLEEMKP